MKGPRECPAKWQKDKRSPLDGIDLQGDVQNGPNPGDRKRVRDRWVLGEGRVGGDRQLGALGFLYRMVSTEGWLSNVASTLNTPNGAVFKEADFMRRNGFKIPLEGHATRIPA